MGAAASSREHSPQSSSATVAADPQQSWPSEHAARVAAIDKTLLVSCKPALWQQGAVWHVSDVRHQVQAVRPTRTQMQPDPVDENVFKSGDHVTTIHGERGTLSTLVVQVDNTGRSAGKFLVLWDNGSQSYVNTIDLVNPSCAPATDWNAHALNEYLRDAKAAQRRRKRSESERLSAAVRAAVTQNTDDVRVRSSGVGLEVWVRRSEAFNDLLALCDAIDERLLWGWGSSSAGAAEEADRPCHPPAPLQATAFARDPVGLYKHALKTKPVRKSPPF